MYARFVTNIVQLSEIVDEIKSHVIMPVDIYGMSSATGIPNTALNTTDIPPIIIAKLKVSHHGPMIERRYRLFISSQAQAVHVGQAIKP